MNASSLRPSLTVLTGDVSGAVFPFPEGEDELRIGSDERCAIRLNLPQVSSVHARLSIDAEGITVYDQSGERGVWVNDDRVVGPTRLHNGDVLWLGPPGDADAVMIGCRIPRPPVETAAVRPAAAEPAIALPPPRDEPAAPPEPMIALPPPRDEPAAAPEPTIALPPPAEEPAIALPPPAEEPAATPEPTIALPPPAEEPAIALPPPVEPTIALAPPDEQPTMAVPAVSAAEPTLALPPPDAEAAIALPPPLAEPDAPDWKGDETQSFDEPLASPLASLPPSLRRAEPPPVVDEFVVDIDDSPIDVEPEATVSMDVDDVFGGDAMAAAVLDLAPEPTVSLEPPAPPDFGMAAAAPMPDEPEPTAYVPRVTPPPAEPEVTAYVPRPVAPPPTLAPPEPAMPSESAPSPTIVVADGVGNLVARTPDVRSAPDPAPAPPSRSSPPAAAPRARPTPASAKPSKPSSARQPAPAPRPSPPRRAKPSPAPAPGEEMEVSPVSAAEPAPPPRRSAGPSPAVLGGGALLLLLVLGGGYWALRSSGTGTATVPPPTAPATVAEAPRADTMPSATQAPAPVELPIDEEVTIVPPVTRPTPAPGSAAPPVTTPRAGTQTAAVPPVTAPAVPVAPPPDPAVALLRRAAAAAAAGEVDGAIALYDEALRAQPGHQAATAGRAAAMAVRAASLRSFVPGRTVVQTQSAKADMEGFDTSDVSVKKAPDFSGRIEFAVKPPKVKPGDSYSVEIFLVNEGKKTIKISSVNVARAVNGSRSGGPLAARTKEVQPGQRALLEDLSGVWDGDVKTWSTEVLVTANRGDSLKNTLTWK